MNLPKKLRSCKKKLNLNKQNLMNKNRRKKKKTKLINMKKLKGEIMLKKCKKLLIN